MASEPPATGSACQAASITCPILRGHLTSDLQVRNRGRAPIDTMTVTLDTAYAGRFSTVTAVPPFTGPFEVQLTDIAAQQSRRVRIEIQAERYWSHSGRLTITAGADTDHVPLTTMVYP